MNNEIIESENGALQLILVGWESSVSDSNKIDAPTRMLVLHNNKMIGTFWSSELNLLKNELDKRFNIKIKPKERK